MDGGEAQRDGTREIEFGATRKRHIASMSAATLWLAVALVLGLAELAAPGVFLVFVAIAAALTGLEVFAAPALPLAAQLASVAMWSAVSVAIGRRWYRDYPVGGDERLNRPTERMTGREVVAEVDFRAGEGRVRVGDGSWPARGLDAKVGDRLRVVLIDNGTLVVEPFVQRRPGSPHSGST